MPDALTYVLVALLSAGVGAWSLYAYASHRFRYRPVSNDAQMLMEASVYDLIYHFDENGEWGPLLLTTREWERATKRTKKNMEDVEPG